MNVDSLTPLAKSYLSAILAAQDAEQDAPPPTIGLIDPHDARSVRAGIEAVPEPALSASEIADIAIERGLAEILHLVTMPGSRSQKIPLGWDQPTDAGELDVATGAGNALRAVRRHVSRMPTRGPGCGS